MSPEGISSIYKGTPRENFRYKRRQKVAEVKARVRNEKVKRPILTIVCSRCRRAGGTLVKRGKGYVHAEKCL